MSRHVDPDGVRSPAFGLSDEMRAGVTSHWHAHGKHQLLYAAAGTLHLEVDGAGCLLPPQRAAFIAAKLRHRVVARSQVKLRTVYLAPRLAPLPDGKCLVFGVTPLAREMILHAMQWGPGWQRDETAQVFFSALAHLTAQWCKDARPWGLPTPRSPAVRRAMQVALDALDAAPTLEDAANAARMSPRTLTRRFQAEANTSWRDFLHQARMLRAMELLSDGESRVTDAALAVGFNSLGAFTRAFEAFSGEKPRDYRRRASA